MHSEKVPVLRPLPGAVNEIEEVRDTLIMGAVESDSFADAEGVNVAPVMVARGDALCEREDSAVFELLSVGAKVSDGTAVDDVCAVLETEPVPSRAPVPVGRPGVRDDEALCFGDTLEDGVPLFDAEARGEALPEGVLLLEGEAREELLSRPLADSLKDRSGLRDTEGLPEGDPELDWEPLALALSEAHAVLDRDPLAVFDEEEDEESRCDADEEGEAVRQGNAVGEESRDGGPVAEELDDSENTDANGVEVELPLTVATLALPLTEAVTETVAKLAVPDVEGVMEITGETDGDPVLV